MPRQATFAVALIVTGLASAAFGAGLSAGASASLPERIMEALSAPPDDHGAWPASQQGVSSPNLQLTLHGNSGKRFSWWPFAGRPISIPSISGQARRRRQVPRRFVIAIASSITLAPKIRWVVRTSGFIRCDRS